MTFCLQQFIFFQMHDRLGANFPHDDFNFSQFGSIVYERKTKNVFLIGERRNAYDIWKLEMEMMVANQTTT